MEYLYINFIYFLNFFIFVIFNKTITAIINEFIIIWLIIILFFIIYKIHFILFNLSYLIM